MGRNAGLWAAGLVGLATLAVGVGTAASTPDFEWNTWLTIAAVAIALTFAIALLDRPENSEAKKTSVVSNSSSGQTVGAVSAGRDVLIGTATHTNEVKTNELVLEIEELEPRRVPNWGDDWRISIRITNLSESDDVSAYVLRPIQGLAEPDVGDMNLQWDTVARNFTTLITGKPEQLRIALVSDDRKLRFLSPGEYTGAPGKVHIHNAVKVAESPVSGKLRFSTSSGRCEQRHFEIHLDHDNKPTIHIGKREPCT